MLLLDDAEIIRRIRSLKQSDRLARNARLLPGFHTLARLSGLRRETLYMMADGTRGIGPRSRAKLQKALTSPEMQRTRSTVSTPTEPAARPISLDFKRFLPENTR
jgi:hypothetical protein